MNELETALKKLGSFPVEQLNITDLLLIDIARSLRAANKHAEESLEWSRSLAAKLDN